VNRMTLVLAFALMAGGVGLAVMGGGDGSVQAAPGVGAPGGETPAVQVVLDSGPGVVQVYKTPTCGCCSGWVEHMREQGFVVETIDLPELSAVKAQLGVDPDLMSCHTSTVDGYVVEGHVPAGTIRKLLAERPAIAGIAAPGMPIGSPGMEGPNPESYDVVAFDRTGTRSVFEHIDPALNPGGGPPAGHEGH
jgi:hypothetical protein